MKSESINELATALAKAQQEIKPALKDAANPFFKSKYADLHSTWDACKDALNKNGLSVVQTMEDQFLITTLLHTSGQWIEGACPLINTKGDMQGLGSAVSYARRYSIAAICGVVSEDDDAQTAVEKPKNEYSSYKSPIANQMEAEKKLKSSGDMKSPTTLKTASPAGNSTPPSVAKITEKQGSMVYAKLANKGYVGPDFLDVLAKLKYRSTDDIPYNKLDEVLAYIEQLPHFMSVKKNPKDIPDTTDDMIPDWVTK